VIGAKVGLSVTGGILVSNSGTTNSNGDFTITYTAPTVTKSTAYTISATASMTGYTAGSRSGQITVNPVLPTPAPTGKLMWDGSFHGNEYRISKNVFTDPSGYILHMHA